MVYRYPGFIPASPSEGSSIIQSSFGVNGLVQSPLVVAASLPTPWEDFNYKSSWKVTGCNPHRFCFITC